MPNINWFALSIRIIEGDLVWFLMGGAAGVIGWLLPEGIKNGALRVIVGLVTFTVSILLIHWAYDSFMAFYTDPLGPHL